MAAARGPGRRRDRCFVAGADRRDRRARPIAACRLVVIAIGLAYDLRLKGTAWSWLPFAVGIPILPVYRLAGRHREPAAGVRRPRPRGGRGGRGPRDRQQPSSTSSGTGPRGRTSVAARPSAPGRPGGRGGGSCWPSWPRRRSAAAGGRGPAIVAIMALAGPFRSPQRLIAVDWPPRRSASGRGGSRPIALAVARGASGSGRSLA